jgi:CRP-like cAMP-binding protein
MKPGSTLAGSELFCGLLPDELAQVEAIARPHELAARARLFRQGEPATTLFVVERGSVALTLPLRIRDTTKDVTVDEKGPGAVVAWSALVPPHRLTLGAEAISEVALVGVQRDELLALGERVPRIKLVLMTNLSQVIASRLYQLEGILMRDLQRWASEACA